MNKRIITITIIVICILLTGIIVYATSYQSNKAVVESEKQAAVAIEEGAKQIKDKPLTEEQEANLAKYDKMRDEVWQDIKFIYEIDETQYLKLEYQDLNEFFKGQADGFKDLDFLKEIQAKIIKDFFSAPLEATKPFILIKKDSSQFIVAYKDKDGNNVLLKNDKVSGNWEKTELKEKGKPIPMIEDM